MGAAVGGAIALALIAYALWAGSRNQGLGLPTGSGAGSVGPSSEPGGGAARDLVYPEEGSATGAREPEAPGPEEEAPAADGAPAPGLPTPTQELAPLPEPVGVLSGRLLPESGVFDQEPSALIRGITLDAVSRVAPRITATAALSPVLDDEGRLVAIDFETEALPAVEFELTLSQLGTRRWDRTSAIALPPQGGIEFLCYDGDDEVAVEFLVVDAVSGEAIDDWEASQFRLSASKESGVLLHAGPLNADKIPVDAALQWIVEADGYAPAFGSEGDFQMSADGSKRAVTVRLERGFATRLVVLGVSPDRVPADRADVWVDGRRVGATDDSGQILLRSKAKPETIEVQWHGQSLKGPFAGACLKRRSHLHVALLKSP